MKHARQDYNRIQDSEGLIPEDEPVFLLRGQDTVAPGVVRFWASGGRPVAFERLADGNRELTIAPTKEVGHGE